MDMVTQSWPLCNNACREDWRYDTARVPVVAVRDDNYRVDNAVGVCVSAAAVYEMEEGEDGNIGPHQARTTVAATRKIMQGHARKC
ncbi:hypothetical protein PoB_003769100 [Plakobranchus ocellatus]|uniref:Uncharacterized protein n=1 Tax=Plakobranchus ocellatus TaxID=259542 RepID=A0AAV4AJ37_9GAST|nr:hypothetical protein PoB_003769100 [Plakobranchus ocellatus]